MTNDYYLVNHQNQTSFKLGHTYMGSWWGALESWISKANDADIWDGRILLEIICRYLPYEPGAYQLALRDLLMRFVQESDPAQVEVLANEKHSELSYSVIGNRFLDQETIDEHYGLKYEPQLR